MASSRSIERSAPLAPVASWRHTTRLAVILLVLAASGALLHGHSTGGAPAIPGRHPSLALLYCSLIVAEWLLFRAVVAGLRSTGTGWRTLIGRASSNWLDLAGDALLGVLLCTIWVAVVLGVRSASADQAAVVPSLLPEGALETALWTLLSVSAGFCEEVTFRGYFQRQFEALSRSKGVALSMQAVLFGIAHVYQGLPSALAIAGYGVLLGALALWRKSLRSGILAHALTDLTLGLAGR